MVSCRTQHAPRCAQEGTKMQKAGIFAALTFLLSVAAVADGDYLETMRQRELWMMNAPRYARAQNPTLRGWALGQIQLTAAEVHQLRAERQLKARQNRAKLGQQAERQRQQSGMGFAAGVGQPAGWGRTPSFPGYAGGRGFGGLSAGRSGGGSPRCGAPTKTTGRPCRNPVKGGGRCHLHR